MIEGKINVEDVENGENAIILNVPDFVWVSKKGKLYYPEKTAMANVEMALETAHSKGYKPSKAYQKFAEKLYKEAAAKKTNA